MSRRVVGCLLLLGCADVRHVRLEVGPLGFTCQESLPPNPYLIDRAVALGGSMASLVVDFIPLGGTPDCRLPGLVGWCTQHACTPLAASRICIPRDLSRFVAGGAPLVQAGLATLMSLSGTSVSSDAPEGPLIVRVVGTTESCDELARSADLSFDHCRVFGCAYSCPTTLQAVDGTLHLDIDFLMSSMNDHACEGFVELCASPRLTPTSSAACGG